MLISSLQQVSQGGICAQDNTGNSCGAHGVCVPTTVAASNGVGNFSDLYVNFKHNFITIINIFIRLFRHPTVLLFDEMKRCSLIPVNWKRKSFQT